MLEFYFDFMDKYIDRSDCVYCQMDTDSAYIAFSGENFEELIKPELKMIIYNINLNGFQEMTQKKTQNLIKERLDYSRRI